MEINLQVTLRLQQLRHLISRVHTDIQGLGDTCPSPLMVVAAEENQSE